MRAAAAPCTPSARLLRLRPALVVGPGGSCHSSRVYGYAGRRARAKASGSGNGIKGAVLHQLGIQPSLARMPNLQEQRQWLRQWQQSDKG